MKKIKYIVVTFSDVRIRASDIPKLRGYFSQKYPQEHLFHNHLPGQGYDFKAPRIQYRIVNRNPALLAIGEGMELLKKVFLEVNELDINGQKISSNEREASLMEEDFGSCQQYQNYRFQSPWMALNQENYRQYLDMDRFQRAQLLKRILKNNLKTLSKAFDYWIPDVDNLNVDGWFKPMKVNFHNQVMQCFTGEFTVNFQIPDLFGLGKQSARGFGVVNIKKGG